MLGKWECSTLLFPQLANAYQWKKGEIECFFVGEMLSTREEMDQVCERFRKTNNLHDLLFLYGNYQTIVKVNGNLILCSDLANLKPLYMREVEGTVWFSNQLSPLVSLGEVNLNVSWIKRWMTTGGIHVEKETPYHEIKQIPGGFAYSLQGRKWVQFWEMDREPLLPWDESVERLEDELVQAVQRRIQGKRVTCDLSGGLDSSTLAILISRHQPVDTLTKVGKEANEDWEIAREIASVHPNIGYHELEQSNLPLIYSGMDRIETDLPLPFLWSANRSMATNQWAKERGSHLHFNGEGGDTLLGASHTYLADLVQRGKWMTFLSHSKGWADKVKQSPWSWMIGAIHLAFNRPFQTKERHPLQLHMRQADWFCFHERGEDIRFSKKIGVHRTLLSLHYLGMIGNGINQLSMRNGVPTTFPYLDHRLIRLSLQTRSEKKMNPRILKPWLKEALADVLPEVLLNRNTKGDYTPDVYQGIRDQQDWFYSFLSESRLRDFGLIDLDKFREQTVRLTMGVPVRLPEFNQTLAMEMWLRQQERSRNKCTLSPIMYC